MRKLNNWGFECLNAFLNIQKFFPYLKHLRECIMRLAAAYVTFGIVLLGIAYFA